MSKTDVLAIFCADLHFSLTPPPLRSKEPDWFAAMQRPVDEIKQLQEEYDCPIFCAGDIFDRWNAPAELINWVMTHLPHMHCIPGQHDLPEHDLSQIERSAYRTLAKSNFITDLMQYDMNDFTWSSELVVYPFPYGAKILPPGKSTRIKVALIHQYNWVKGFSYGDQAPKQGFISFKRRPEFEGYDLIVSGDNHMPFTTLHGKGVFVNCGGLMRRKADDLFDPCVWLLHRSGEVVRHRLDISEDVYLESTKAREAEKTQDTDLSGLMQRLEELGACALDFVAAMKLDLETNHTRRGVESRIVRAMEN